jgi:hypothetical protein
MGLIDHEITQIFVVTYEALRYLICTLFDNILSIVHKQRVEFALKWSVEYSKFLRSIPHAVIVYYLAVPYSEFQARFLELSSSFFNYDSFVFS